MNQTAKILIVLLLILLPVALYYMFAGGDNDDLIADIQTRSTSGTAIKIIAFGDSLTAGYGLPAEESYPAQLEKALLVAGFSVDVINSGVSGETSRGNLERAAFIRSQNPDIVLLGIGGNDALRLLPVDETEKNIEQTIVTLQSGENPPLIVLLKMQAPLNVGLGYKQKFDAIYENVASRNNILIVPFLTTEIFLNKENKIADGIHLNQTGYKKVVDMYMLPVLEPVLSKMQK